MADFASALLAARGIDGVADLFGRLIGAWRVRNRSLDENTGEWSESEFTWTFARTLGGLAVQDVIVRDDGATAGTTVRAWDADREVWRVAWFGVLGRNFSTFTATASGADGIRLDGSGEDGRALHWEFSGISPDRFAWDGRVQTDDGWLLEQHMDAVRIGSPED